MNDEYYQGPYDCLTSVKIYNDSILYVAGCLKIDSTLVYDKKQKMGYPKRNVNSQEGILMKIDASSGDLLWYAFQGGQKNDLINDLDIDSKGNIYVTGSLPGDNNNYAENEYSSYVYSSDLQDTVKLHAYYDQRYGLFIAKYSPQGKVIWARRQGDSGINGYGSNPISLRLCSDKSIVIVALSLDNTFFFDNDTTPCGTSSNSHQLILKLDSMGNKKWCTIDRNIEKVFSVGIDQWDNIYVPTCYSAYVFEDYLKKCDSNGNIIWKKKIQESYGSNYITTTDRLGNTYVAYDYGANVQIGGFTTIIKQFDSSGTVTSVSYPYPFTPDQVNGPTSIAFNHDQSQLYLAGIYKGSQTFGESTIESTWPAFYLTMLDSNSTEVSGLNHEMDQTSSITLFPNPSNGKISIRSAIKIKTIELMDVTGNTLLVKKHLYEDEPLLDLSLFSKGVYLLKIIDESNMPILKKIILN